MVILIFGTLSVCVLGVFIELVCLTVKSLGERVFHPVYVVSVSVCVGIMLFFAFIIPFSVAAMSYGEWRYEVNKKAREAEEEKQDRIERAQAEVEGKARYEKVRAKELAESYERFREHEREQKQRSSRE